jgi:23S rRNA pseudouridine955/2504/2580 synthase
LGASIAFWGGKRLHECMQEIEMTTAEEGQRLDRYLRKLLPETPLGAIFKMLRRGVIRVDGKKAGQDLRLAAGMKVTLPPSVLQAPAVSSRDSKPPNQASRESGAGLQPIIRHQDDDFMVVEKPAGFAVQPGSGQEHHVVSWLETQQFGVRTRTYRPAPVHRLDRGTSGLLVIGLSPHGSRALADAFREDLVRKSYVAVVDGVPKAESGTIDAPLWLRETARAHQPKVLVDPRGKPSRTVYSILRATSRRALLQLELHTGRTHQIRAHLGHLGHAIVGDTRYGSRSDLGRGVFLLHAARISLPHPITGEEITLYSKTPARFNDALSM